MFRINREQKEYIQKKLEKWYSSFRTGGFFYREYIKKHLKDNMIILDAGCGDSGIISEFKKQGITVIGLDREKDLLEKNVVVDRKILGDLEHVPLKDNSIDMVVSEFVLEHIEDPQKVLNEIHRVLKPQGVFIFLTPNVLNPIMMISKFLPHSLHTFARIHLLRKDEETHKTYYKVNTYSKIQELSQKAGFEKCELQRAGNPEYLGFWKPLVIPSILFERLIHAKILRFLQMYLIGKSIK